MLHTGNDVAENYGLHRQVYDECGHFNGNRREKHFLQGVGKYNQGDGEECDEEKLNNNNKKKTLTFRIIHISSKTLCHDLPPTSQCI